MFLVYYVAGTALALSNERDHIEEMVERGQQITAAESQAMLLEAASAHLSATSFLISAVIIMSILCAFQGFDYLYYRHHIDFFHSLPVKKSRQFLVIWLNGLLTYLVPALVCMLLAGFIAGGQEATDAALFGKLAGNFFLFLALFIAVYHVNIIAVMLTGHMGISLFAAGILQGYEAGILMLRIMYLRNFAGDRNIIVTLPEVMYTTPYWWYNEAVNREAVSMPTAVLWLLAQGLVFMILAYFAYQARPSEAAGLTLSFRKFEPFIKAAIAIPAGLCAGALVGVRLLPILVAIVVTTVLTCGLLEAVFQFDIKAALANKRDILVITALVLVLHFGLRWVLILSNMRKIDRFLQHQIPMGRARIAVIDFIFAICVLAISLWARIVLFPHISGDWVSYSSWMQEVKAKGGILSLRYEISSYASAYMIALSILSYLPGEPLYVLKAFAVFFDYLAAFAVFVLLCALTHKPRRALVGACVLLMTPTVLLNGAYWGQCDMIYVAFVLLGLCYYCHNAFAKAMWLVGIAFAFKLQALFIVPFFIIMWLCPYVTAQGRRREINPLGFLILPLPYILFAVPGMIMGRGVASSLGVYFSQAESFPWLTLNYPNIYAFFGQTYLLYPVISELAPAGTLMTVLALGLLAYSLYKNKARMDAVMMIATALFSLCLILYGLPHMHERYGLLIDVFAVVYAVLRPARIPLAAGLVASSLMSYRTFLFGSEALPPLPHALIQLVLVVFVGMDLYALATRRESTPPASAKQTGTRGLKESPTQPDKKLQTPPPLPPDNQTLPTSPTATSRPADEGHKPASES
jgi:Gpi18-like mannosyltransferase